MENQLSSLQNQEFSTEWLDLSNRIRNLAEQMMSRTRGTVFFDDASSLVTETSKLCDHLERMHRDIGELVAKQDVEEESVPDPAHPALQSAEVQREAVKIHREGHELKPDLKDIIKALFMWQDDPVERTRKNHQAADD